MTEDQQLMWDLLTVDPEKLAHRFGQELAELAKIRGRRQFNKRADEIMFYVMNNVYEPMSVIRIIKIWLSDYRLPFVPDRMESFERFHTNYGGLIHSLMRNGKIKTL